MDPYERTAQEMKRQAQGPRRLVKGLGQAASAAAGIGAGVAAAPMFGRIAPFLSNFIPQDLAVKGLSKIHPKLGKFVDDALKSGFDFDEAKDFLGEQVTASQSAQQEKNIIERFSPELHQFMSDQIKQGRNAYQAGAIASKDKRFRNAIEKLTKEHKISWADVIEQVYGQGAPKGKQTVMQQETERFNEAYPSAQGQQPGQGQQALMSILAKINQSLGQ